MDGEGGAVVIGVPAVGCGETFGVEVLVFGEG